MPKTDKAPDPDTDRYWNGEQWVWPEDVNKALDAAQLAIDEYYNGNREWAERWLLSAHKAGTLIKP